MERNHKSKYFFFSLSENFSLYVRNIFWITIWNKYHGIFFIPLQNIFSSPLCGTCYLSWSEKKQSGGSWFFEWLDPNLVWFQLKNPSNVNRHQFFVSKYIYQDYSWGRIYQIFFFKSNIIIKYLERRKKTDPDPVSRRCLMIVSLMRICTDPDPTLPSGGNTIFLNLKKVNPRFSQGLWTQYCFLKSEKFIYIIPKLLSL